MRTSNESSQLQGAFVAAVAAIAMSVCGGWAGEPASDASSATRSTAELVKLALESELAGQPNERDRLLRKAVEQSPDDASAHWQSGQVRVGDKWLSPTDMATAAKQDERLAQYRRLRDEAGRTVDDQASLARWCRKNRLDDEQRAHWQTVLQLQPDNAEAIAALKLRPYFGALMTPAQIRQTQRQIQDVLKAADAWRPLVAKWCRAADSGDSSLPAAVGETLRVTSDAAEVLGLERALWQQAGRKRRAFQAMLLAMMPALGKNPHPAAAASLARYAVFANFDDVRTAAIAELKRRPLDQYAMLLLSGLQSRIEADAVVSGQTVHCSVYREGALADLALSHSLSLFTFAGPGAGTAAEPVDAPVIADRTRPVNAASRMAKAGTAARARTQAGMATYALNRAKGSFLDAVDRTNDAIQQQNSRISTVLREVTSLSYGDDPMDWWKWWWQDYNEMYDVRRSKEGGSHDQPPKPVYTRDTYATLWLHSCFAPGTKVWTLTGQQPIEKIKVGDRVLAQDIESGELAYKPVLAVTTRQPGPWMKIGLGAEAITATPSHPFWVSGQGWRMTKQLEAGCRVRSLSGSVPVENIETPKLDISDGEAAYNLIVADFSSYFVGDRGILVHDNTTRNPTAALLPGLVGRSNRANSADREAENPAPVKK